MAITTQISWKCDLCGYEAIISPEQGRPPIPIGGKEWTELRSVKANTCDRCVCPACKHRLITTWGYM